MSSTASSARQAVARAQRVVVKVGSSSLTTPGGGLDIVGRELDTALHEAKLFAQPFVIKNTGGAAGNLAKSYVH